MKYLTMKKYIMHIHIVVMKDKVTKITTDSIRIFLPKGTKNTTQKKSSIY
ncbi:hypothetical protein HMPREF3188_01487 [Tissierellia bacterium KA00581]|nr:hypothetical protein HMPREF3188_01487 [Tissierellia bacterium KA00581]